MAHASSSDEDDEEAFSASPATGKKGGAQPKQRPGGKTIEQRYQKKTQVEHILLRPDTYIGSTELHTQQLWVLDEGSEPAMVNRTINYVPGLYKIVDEILVNAADVKAREAEEQQRDRTPKPGAKKISAIKIDINSKGDGVVSVWNDGEGIPVVIHQVHKVYVPELIFGQLLTSDNYDDSECRVTGGRNGYGAKLTNIFSKEFSVECGDGERKKRFKMTWRNNMSVKSEPQISAYNGSDFVKISFLPDFEKFGMRGFDEDSLALLKKRAYDLAGTSGVRVYLNGDRIPVSSFLQYVDLYLGSSSSKSRSAARPASAAATAAADDATAAAAGGGGGGESEERLGEKRRPVRERAARLAAAGGGGGGAAAGGGGELFSDSEGGDEDDDAAETDSDDEEEEEEEWDDGRSKKKKQKKAVGRKKDGGGGAAAAGGGGRAAAGRKTGGPRNGEKEEDEEGRAASPEEKIIKIHDRQWRWEVVISSTDSGQLQQVSFVNSICTTKGGSHVAHVLEPLLAAIVKKANSKNRGGMEIKAAHVKQHLWVFVNCLIVNPAFDSQTKETLTTKAAKFGSKCELQEKTINAVLRSAIVENVVLWAQTKQQVELRRQMKVGKTKGRERLVGIPKLEDANDAGGRHAAECTLILTEGDSAKTSCLAGLSVVGRDRYGVFPLRGKLLNVRDASFKQLAENKEIQNILKIVGLQVHDKTEDSRGLRYGSVMIMTDQDHDGSHIKGLLINLVHHYWPQLLRCSGFLKEFVTPIVKVSRNNEVKAFYTLPEYEQWKKECNTKGWKIKYYKGLGTSTDREFREYFNDLAKHRIDFVWSGQHDGELIDMAFNKRRAEDRKRWLQSYQEGTYVDHAAASKRLSYADFVNKELILFSRYDTERSIPQLIDGWKPGQRKVLFACIKKNMKQEIKVAQLAGYVSEVSAYHHGEASLQQTIVSMAQRFVGSNNLNFLEPVGQFGSRKEGGKDASAARYIFTKLAFYTRLVFHEADDPLLDYEYEEGQRIEPKMYVPIIPTVLVNGAEGIGTGWSSFVPNYNPRDIISNLKRYIAGEEMQRMTPWYRGFRGKIEGNTQGTGFETTGLISQTSPGTYEITELPVKRWTQDYKEWLEEQLPTAEKRDTLINDYRDCSSHEDIHFTVKIDEERLGRPEREGVEKYFKLKTSLSTTNLTLFDVHGHVQKYATELDIMKAFAPVRLEYYHRRKAYCLATLEKMKKILDNKLRFILAVISGEVIVHNKRKATLVEELFSKGFDPMREIEEAAHVEIRAALKREKAVEDEQIAEQAEDEGPGAPLLLEGRCSARDFDYLLGMPLWSLTMEKVEELREEARSKELELQELKQTTPEQLWVRDLNTLEKALDQQDAMDQALLEEGRSFQKKARAGLHAAFVQKKAGGSGKTAAAAASSGRKAASAAAAAAAKGGGGAAAAAKGKKKRRASSRDESDSSSEESLSTEFSLDSDGSSSRSSSSNEEDDEDDAYNDNSSSSRTSRVTAPSPVRRRMQQQPARGGAGAAAAAEAREEGGETTEKAAATPLPNGSNSSAAGGGGSSSSSQTTADPLHAPGGARSSTSNSSSSGSLFNASSSSNIHNNSSSNSLSTHGKTSSVFLSSSSLQQRSAATAAGRAADTAAAPSDSRCSSSSSAPSQAVSGADARQEKTSSSSLPLVKPLSLLERLKLGSSTSRLLAAGSAPKKQITLEEIFGTAKVPASLSSSSNTNSSSNSSSSGSSSNNSIGTSSSTGSSSSSESRSSVGGGDGAGRSSAATWSLSDGAAAAAASSSFSSSQQPAPLLLSSSEDETDTRTRRRETAAAAKKTHEEEDNEQQQRASSAGAAAAACGGRGPEKVDPLCVETVLGEEEEEAAAAAAGAEKGRRSPLAAGRSGGAVRSSSSSHKQQQQQSPAKRGRGSGRPATAGRTEKGDSTRSSKKMRKAQSSEDEDEGEVIIDGGSSSGAGASPMSRSRPQRRAAVEAAAKQKKVLFDSDESEDEDDVAALPSSSSSSSGSDSDASIG